MKADWIGCEEESMNAPVVVFGYNRMAHMQKTLQALEVACRGREKELYVFLDGAKEDKDASDVAAVQAFAKQYACETHGYKEMHVEIASENRGLAASVIQAVSKVLALHGSVIVVEDDLLVAPSFIAFMDDALAAYEKDSRIWSIGGWIPQQMEGIALEDAFLSRRAECWGWATWRDRWETIDWEMATYRKEFRYALSKRVDFNRAGNDMTGMLDAYYEGRIHSWAIRFAYAQWKSGRFVVCPKYSLVINDGMDGSGTNCHENAMQQNVYAGKLTLPETLVEDKALMKKYAGCMSHHGLRRVWRPVKHLIHMLQYDMRHR